MFQHKLYNIFHYISYTLCYLQCAATLTARSSIPLLSCAQGKCYVTDHPVEGKKANDLDRPNEADHNEREGLCSGSALVLAIII